MSVVGLLRPTLELNGTVLKSRDQYCVSSSVCPHQCFTSGDGFGWVRKKKKKKSSFFWGVGGVGGGEGVLFFLCFTTVVGVCRGKTAD